MLVPKSPAPTTRTGPRILVTALGPIEAQPHRRFLKALSQIDSALIEQWKAKRAAVRAPGSVAKELRTLKALLDGPTFSSFEQAIRGRAERNEKAECTLIGFEASDVAGAEMQGDFAQAHFNRGNALERLGRAPGPDVWYMGDTALDMAAAWLRFRPRSTMIKKPVARLLVL